MELFAGPLLAIETSCDETSVAVLEGRAVRSLVIASQVEMHQKWGGVVPEAAARAHVEAILPTLQEALDQADLRLDQIEGFAVTYGPGLVPALNVGVAAAKTLQFATGKPLLGVHHLEGHLLSPWIEHDVPLPHLALIVSGGHTELIEVRGLGDYVLRGETRDDAAGEAFDKSARLLGLGYPGGPAIQRAAREGRPTYPLPRGLKGDTFDFSFSGFKTAVLRLVQSEGNQLRVNDAAASVQETIVEVLAERAIRAAEHAGARALTLSGGVAANLALRQRLAEACDRVGIGFFVPSVRLCTDNAAMIGFTASMRLARGERSEADLDVASNLPLPGLREA